MYAARTAVRSHQISSRAPARSPRSAAGSRSHDCPARGPALRRERQHAEREQLKARGAVHSCTFERARKRHRQNNSDGESPANGSSRGPFRRREVGRGAAGRAPAAAARARPSMARSSASPQTREGQEGVRPSTSGRAAPESKCRAKTPAASIARACAQKYQKIAAGKRTNSNERERSAGQRSRAAGAVTALVEVACMVSCSVLLLLRNLEQSPF